MKKRNYRAQKVNEIRWEEVADRVKERTVVWAIDVAKVEQYGVLMDSEREVALKALKGVVVIYLGASTRLSARAGACPTYPAVSKKAERYRRHALPEREYDVAGMEHVSVVTHVGYPIAKSLEVRIH